MKDAPQLPVLSFLISTVSTCARVQVKNLPGLELVSLTTDQQGTAGPKFTLPDWKDGKYTLRVVARTDGADERLSRTVELRRDWKLMLSTDKPVYQPGQTIRLRSLALRRPDLKPVTGQEMTFAITDPKQGITVNLDPDDQFEVGEVQLRAFRGPAAAPDGRGRQDPGPGW